MFPVIMQHYSKEEIKKPSQVFSEYDFFFWLRIRIVQEKKEKRIQNEIHGIYRKLFVTF